MTKLIMFTLTKLFYQSECSRFQTSLLMAILGELPLTDGSIDISGKLTYVAQGSWVFGASVRENILFGEPFEAEKYGKVIEAAALKRVSQFMR